MVKHILVTGASSGIGLALCKLLIRDHSCYVYLGSRNVAKGESAKKTILEEVPDKSDMIEVVQIDVGNDFSVKAAAKALRDRGNWLKFYTMQSVIVLLKEKFICTYRFSSIFFIVWISYVTKIFLNSFRY